MSLTALTSAEISLPRATELLSTLADQPGNPSALLLRARCHADQCEYAPALEDGKLALAAARKGAPDVLRAVLR